MLSQSQKYYIPEPSRWPIFGAVALFFMALGTAMWFNGVSIGPLALAIGLAILAYMLFGWFGTVAAESEGGKFNRQVDISFRWGMSWFIFSEVMFFRCIFRRPVLHAGTVDSMARVGRYHGVPVAGI